jgi:hypothetical protein
MDLADFLHQLQSDVLATAQGDVPRTREATAQFKEDAFTELVTDELAAAGVLESPVVCHHDGGPANLDFKVSGYGIPDEDTQLDLFVTLYFQDGSVQRLNSADVDRVFKKLTRFLSAALTQKFHEQLEPGSDVSAMVSEMLRRKEQFDRVQLFLLTNGLVATRKEAERKEQLKDYKLTYEIWDLERLRRLRSSGMAQEPIAVDLTRFEPSGIPCIAVKDDALGYKTCMALFPGSILHGLYNEYGSRLLELNVRSYLQARGKVNKQILATLVKEPFRFLAYNNGITIVAEGINFSTDGTRILSIDGMQIVNGGQTTASIHRAKQENSADLSHVYVQAKLTVVALSDFEEMVPQISRFSNSQNKVSEVDLRANHPYHIGIERVSLRQYAPGEKSKWFYERARGSYQTARAKIGTRFDREYPSNQRFNKEDLARYANSWLGLPHIVSRGGQKNFVRFMETVPAVPKGWEIPNEDFKDLIGKAIIYKRTQTLAREAGIPSFRVNVVNYTVALIAEKTARRIDLSNIWDIQDLPESLSNLVREWLQKVATELTASAGARNPTEWFKSEQCWTHMREAAKDWALPDKIRTALKTVGDSGTGDYRIQNNIARCLEVSAQTWFKIQIWGSETGNLEPWQCGIANTLAGYAAAGWRKKPSEKQAKYAVEMLTAAYDVIKESQ